MSPVAEAVSLARELLPIVTLVLGAWLGLRFGVLRDKRSERNQVVDRIRARLLEARQDGGPTPMDKFIDSTDLDLLQQMTGKREWAMIESLVTRYRSMASKYERDRVGQPFYGHIRTKELDALIVVLLEKIRRH
ncbi:MAG: hypothetical protein KF871_14010 [Hydrogenophaga sp.]|uniref:hypothetical protein n=1 Tax=Hydrogenophaga sp. TaxID=1904254 RepID=UPI001E0B2B4A|nr:hypothetical protein [Hydrogenophaga sp.]MBX3611001.1 hypothetical protein [Hydrogenophaga sp.]